MRIFISNINPLNFTAVDRVLHPQYNYRHFDEWQATERMQNVHYGHWCQKWQSGDSINIQVNADYSPVQWRLMDERGVYVQSGFMAVRQVINNMIYQELELPLTGLNGCYKLVLSDADENVLIESNDFCVKEKWSNTLLFEYSHNLNDKGILFETNMAFMIRGEGGISEYEPQGNRTQYIDQTANLSTVTGTSWREYTLHLSGAYGVPEWLIDKFQNIFDLDSLMIDGKPFAAIGEIKTIRVDKYGYIGGSVKIREGINRTSKAFTSTGIVTGRMMVDIVVEGKLFTGIGGTNNTDYTIQIKE